MITVRHTTDIYRRSSRDDVILSAWEPGAPVLRYLPQEFNANGGHMVLLNGRSLSGEEVDTFIPGEDSSIDAVELPGFFAAAYPLAGAASAAAIAAGTAGAGAYGVGTAIAALVADFVIMTALSIGISYGIAAIQGPSKLPRGSKDEDGPSRNFSGIQDTAGAGLPVPFIYGEVRSPLHFIQSFERPINGQQVQDGITTLHTLGVWAMGPIESVTDIEINGNDAATIPDLSIVTRLGAYDQGAIPGFSDVNIENVIERILSAAEEPVTYFTVREVDAFEITFRFPEGLFKVGKNSQSLREMDVQFRIDYRPFAGLGSGGSYTELFKTVSAKARNPFKAQIKVESLRKSQYEIRITRLTKDDEQEAGQGLNQRSLSQFYALTEIVYEAQAHPSLAITGFKQVPSAQLNSSVPTNYTGLLKGFNNIRIYSDANNYTVGYTNNPAWCLAHFLCTAKHGMGDQYTYENNLYLDDFLRFAAYCATQVPDGKGGFEARCEMGYRFDTYGSGEDTLEIFTRGTGAILRKEGSKWGIELDEEDSPVWAGNVANVARGSLKLTFLPPQERANRIRAIFQDQERDFQRESYFLELTDLQQGDNIYETTREMFPVTRKSQIARELTRLLLHNKFGNVMVECEAGIDSFRLAPGKLFTMFLPQGGIGLASGRVLEVDETTSVLRLDEEVTFETGKQYEIIIRHASLGTQDTKRITNAPGTTDQITVADVAWTSPMVAGDLYGVGVVEGSNVTFRCISCTLGKTYRRKITGLRYDKQVYTLDLGALGTTFNTSVPDPRLIPPDVEDLTLFEHLEYSPDGTLTVSIDVDWSAPISATVAHYEVWWREVGSAGFRFAGETRVTSFSIREVEAPGVTYEITVVPVTSYGVRKSILLTPSATVTTQSVTDQPPDPVGLDVFVVDGTLVCVCDLIERTLLGPTGGYEWRRGTSWNSGVLLEKTQVPRFETKTYARGATTILVKAVNSALVYSVNAASFSVTLYGQVEENIVFSAIEGPGWAGTLSGFQDTGTKLEMYEPVVSMVATPPMESQSVGFKQFSFGFPPPTQQVVLTSTYTTPVHTVAGGVAVRARADIDARFTPIYIALGTFDAATFPFDSDTANIPFSGDESDKVQLRIESRVSVTDLLETSFTAWKEHRQRAEMTMKYIQYRIILTVESDAYTAQLDQSTLSIDLPDKVVSGTATTLSAVSGTVTYPTGTNFVAVKRILTTSRGGGNGYTVKIYNDTLTGFTYEIRDGADALVAGTTDWEARGY